MTEKPPVEKKPPSRGRLFQRLSAWEHAFVRRLHDTALPGSLHRLLVIFVRVGDGWGWAAIAAILFALLPWMRFKGIVGQAILAVAVSLPIYWSFKFAFRRPRPYVSVPGVSSRVPPLDKYSFPSGHTMNNLAVAMTLALNIPHLWPFAIAIPVSLGLLRILFGVHFLTDIAGGAFLGAVSALSAHWLFPRLFS